jgi:hypothetical protein
MSQANVQQYYQQFEEQQTQSLIDQEVKELLCQTVAAFAQQQIGGAFHQNLATLPSGQYEATPFPFNATKHASDCFATTICTYFRYS